MTPQGLGAIGVLTYPFRLAKWKLEEPKRPGGGPPYYFPPTWHEDLLYKENRAAWLARKPGKFTW